MLKSLEPAERLRLMKFLCSFAWADLEVREQEREFVAKLAARFGLDDDERSLVAGWLRTPPLPEEVDPTAIPLEHRRVFLEKIEEITLADEEISPEERENLSLFKQLLSGGPEIGS
ncbi:MAG: TerB family tellurite resistance protein [bacterium]|nr:TerB family tellurite resistance protein [bacterium]